MNCPRCQCGKLWIFVRFSGYVLCQSSTDDEVAISQSASMNSDWDEDSPCRCSACHWTGSVGDVRDSSSPSGGKAVRTRVPVTSLAEVKRRLTTQPCPVVWSDCIRFLMARVHAAEKQVQDQTVQIEKLRQKPQKKKGAESDETQIM